RLLPVGDLGPSSIPKRPLIPNPKSLGLLRNHTSLVSEFPQILHMMASSLLKCVLLAAASAAAAAQSPAVVIPLDKQYVPVLKDDRIVSYKTAYFGTIFMGSPQPQNFTVVFDTGSGHFFLPSTSCKSDTCKRHKRYDSRISASAVDIDHRGQKIAADASQRDQVAISFGTGEVTGEFIDETVCLTEHSGLTSSTEGLPQDCTRVRVVMATEMTQEPFSTFHFDGVMGLGLETLAVDPGFSVFEQLVARKRQNFAPSFGYFLSDNDDVPSEISFGGHDPRRMASEMQWVPAQKPELGFWQVKVLSISVGSEQLPLCADGSCVAVADTGTSLLGVPRQAAQRLHWLLARKVPENPSEIDCRDFPGPDLVFELEGGVRLTLGAKEYSRPTAMKVEQSQTKKSQVVCRASLLPVDSSQALGLKSFILGEPMLRKYYTAYDWQQRKVGFALAKQPAVATDAAQALQTEVPRQHHVIGAPPVAPQAPSVIHV
ncbi:unnamed protein product, partial [Polarella glacialis]